MDNAQVLPLPSARPGSDTEELEAPPVLPPSRRLFADTIVAEVLAGAPCIVIEGQQGIGKTTLLRAIAGELRGQPHLAVRLPSPALSPPDVQNMVNQVLGIEASPGDQLDPAQLLRSHRAADAPEGIVLLFDDAHRLSDKMLRYLMLMIDLFQFGPATLHIVLIGRLDRLDRLEAAALSGPGQPITGWYFIAPLEADEAEAYLASRLQLTHGSRPRRMRRAARARLIAETDGNPGRINEAADNLPPGRSAVAWCIAGTGLPALALLLAALTGWHMPGTTLQRWWHSASSQLSPFSDQRTTIGGASPIEGGKADTEVAPPAKPDVVTVAPETDRPVTATAEPERRGGPGLALLVKSGDTMPALYARIYRGLTPPPYEQVVAINRLPLKPGAIVIFPEPPQGWSRH